MVPRGLKSTMSSGRYSAEFSFERFGVTLFATSTIPCIPFYLAPNRVVFDSKAAAAGGSTTASAWVICHQGLSGGGDLIGGSFEALVSDSTSKGAWSG